MKNPFSIFCEFIKKIINKFRKEKTQEILYEIHKEEIQEKDYKPYIINQNSKHTINGTIIFKGD